MEFRARIMNAFEILGVTRNCTKEELKKAYKAKAKLLHPDVPGGDANAFKTVDEAYKTIKKYYEEKGWTKKERLHNNIKKIKAISLKPFLKIGIIMIVLYYICIKIIDGIKLITPWIINLVNTLVTIPMDTYTVVEVLRYFVPTMVALLLKSPHKGKLFLLNLALGWNAIAWVILVILSFIKGGRKSNGSNNTDLPGYRCWKNIHCSGDCRSCSIFGA